MDLGTVKIKMDRREYTTPAEFASDIRYVVEKEAATLQSSRDCICRLIFNNCYTYNPETHDVVAMAKKLQAVRNTKSIVRTRGE